MYSLFTALPLILAALSNPAAASKSQNSNLTVTLFPSYACTNFSSVVPLLNYGEAMPTANWTAHSFKLSRNLLANETLSFARQAVAASGESPGPGVPGCAYSLGWMDASSENWPEIGSGCWEMIGDMQCLMLSNTNGRIGAWPSSNSSSSSASTTSTTSPSSVSVAATTATH